MKGFTMNLTAIDTSVLAGLEERLNHISCELIHRA